MTRYRSIPTWTWLALPLLWGCPLAVEQPLEEGDTTEELPSSVGQLKSAVPRRSTGDVPAQELRQLAASINRVGWSLYEQLPLDGGENVLLSPLSIVHSLAMAYAGAEGETQREMERVLSVDLPEPRYHQAFNALEAALHHHDGSMTLQLVTGAWVQTGLAVRQEYLDILAEHYGASLYEVDFLSNPELVRQDINRWVAAATDDRISELLPAGELQPDARLVLTNGVTFLADWAERFDPANTQPHPFEQADGQLQEVAMMWQQARMPYADGPWGELVELPYADDQWSMLALLPPEGRREAILPAELLGEIDQELRQETVRLKFPRFSTRSAIELKPLLVELGMVEAFSNGADFSGITGDFSLKLSSSHSQAFVAVDEQGSEVRAATGTVVVEKGASPVRQLVFDRPFTFLIRHRPTGVVLLLGRVNAPAAG